MALSVHLERFITEELCVVIDEAKCIITVNRVRDEVDNFEFDGPSTCFRNKDASFVKLGRAGKKKKRHWSMSGWRRDSQKLRQRGGKKRRSRTHRPIFAFKVWCEHVRLDISFEALHCVVKCLDLH